MAEEKQIGVLRNALEYASGVAWSLYSRAEKMPVVSTAIGFAKPFAPLVTPVVSRVAVIADPWINKADVIVTGGWDIVNERIIVPACDEDGKLTFTSLYCQVREFAGDELTKQYANLLDVSDRTVDYLLPDANAEETHSKSLVEVRSKVQKRVQKQLQERFTVAEKYSVELIKARFGVDTVELVSEQFAHVTNWLKASVFPVYDQVSALASAIIVDSRRFVSEKKTLVSNFINSLRGFATQKYEEVSKYATAKAEELKVKPVSFEEVSEFVLVKLHFKPSDDKFVIVEGKISDLLKTLGNLIISRDIAAVFAGKQQKHQTEQTAQ
eukprot:TRINITY_DN796_c0_g1_i1.p1 TRINITY_DN796_c0_g1~~TRINITY_DN796_c0_g1_i1.p1  ORF type:complete len:325 (-),score=89.95 TRINITY_DN796_c0_g1_i1:58-1032(-)